MRILYVFAFALLLGSCKESEKAPATLVVAQPTVKQVSVSEMEAMLQDGNVQLVDVRTPEEFNDGHVPDAINIDYKSADYERSLEVLDLEKPILVYCRSGRRSAKGSEVMRSLGAKEVYELKGGILQWEKEGKLIFTPDEMELN